MSNFSNIADLNDAKINLELKKYSGKTIVVKYGGSAMKNQMLKSLVIANLALLVENGIRVVLVHGGGQEINELLEKIDKKSHFINGLRHTDQETMEIVQMVLAGKINKNLVNMLEAVNISAVGLCGIDAKTLEARQMNENLGLVGEIVRLNLNLILLLLKEGYLPVVSSIGRAIGEEKNISGNNNYLASPAVLNLNADHVAASIAASLKADRLIMISNVPGVLKSVNDEKSLIKKIKKSEIDILVKNGTISSGMLPKLAACKNALASGLKEVNIINGSIPNALILAILGKEEIGTVII